MTIMRTRDFYYDLPQELIAQTPQMCIRDSLNAALQPAQRPLTGQLGVCVGSRVFHTLVKGHGDVRPQVGLNPHGLLRPHENSPAIHMTLKGDALLLNVAQFCQGKNLKTAAVRQNRAVPLHKFVEAAHRLHYIVPRTHMERCV